MKARYAAWAAAALLVAAAAASPSRPPPPSPPPGPSTSTDNTDVHHSETSQLQILSILCSVIPSAIIVLCLFYCFSLNRRRAAREQAAILGADAWVADPRRVLLDINVSKEQADLAAGLPAPASFAPLPAGTWRARARTAPPRPARPPSRPSHGSPHRRTALP